MDNAAEARRKKRANYEVRIYREGDRTRMDEDEIGYWERIPVDERAAFVWQLSQEVYALGRSDGVAESRLPRSIVSVIRS